MPIYDYVCRSCGRAFEELVYGSQTVRCPSCGANEVDKQLSTFAVGKGRSEPAPVTGCGSCGDPRGPGACRWD